jgi:hypothetical protein
MMDSLEAGGGVPRARPLTLGRRAVYVSCDPALRGRPLFVHPRSFVFEKEWDQVRMMNGFSISLYSYGCLLQMPEFVVYHEIIEGSRLMFLFTPKVCLTLSRIYMRGVTAVLGSWLPQLAAGTPLISHSAPLSLPQPHFNTSTDEVMCHLTPYFGGDRWQLPTMPVLEVALC